MKVALFADDSSLYIIGDSLKDLIIQTNSELDKFYDWVIGNRLSVHLDKTKYLILTNKKHGNLPPLFLNYDIIERVSYHKVLGMTLDQNLSFKYHVQDMCQKLSRSVSLFYNIKKFVPLNVLIM